MTSSSNDPVPSPCISICRMEPSLGSTVEQAAGGLCVGCLRTIGEIVEWGSASQERKRDIVGHIDARRPP